MTFLESIKTCLIDKPFTFSGRASRSEFWLFFLFYFLGFLVLVGWVNGRIPLAIHFVILLVVSSVTCRRLHDINRSGWWQLINFIPVVITMFIFIVITMVVPYPWNIPIPPIGALSIILSCLMPLIWLRWMIKKGTPGPNRFGEDPLQQPQFMNTETGLVGETNHPAPTGHPSDGGEK
jgi:uncharacterized membrane protein YhaH (DUF805 family)